MSIESRATFLAKAYAGPALTLASVTLTELFTHFIGVEETLSSGLLLAAFVPIAYSARKAGMGMGLLSSVILAAYTFHFMGPHTQLVHWAPDGWRAVLIIFALGIGMSWPMARMKLREDRLRQALEERALALESRNAALVQANETLEAFGYVVSHDLKEPVRALENYLDAALQEWPGEDARKLVNEAYRANERLARLLQGLLDYSRLSSTWAIARPLNVSEVVESDACRSQYEKMLGETGGQLRVEPGIPPVLGDEVILAQLMGNLILNALRHRSGETGAHVFVSHEMGPSGRVHLLIRDDGPGFQPDILARFARLRGDRPSTIKSGFGLVIAQRAAQRLGAQMSIRNAMGGGAEVRIDMPAAAGHARAPPRSAVAAPA